MSIEKFNKKQTAVEYLVEQLNWVNDYNIDGADFVEKAKELEKQQIKDAFGVGWEVGYNDEIAPSYLTAEKYIERTFE